MALSITDSLDFPVDEKFMQCGERDEARIHFEKFAQCGTAFATAKAVGAQAGQAARQPLADHVGQSLQVVGSRYQDAGRVAQGARDVRHALFFAGMQAVPAFRLVPVHVKLLVAGYAPDIGGDAKFRFQNFLGLQGFAKNRAAAKKLRAQF